MRAKATLATMGWVVSNYLIAGREPIPMGNENATASPSGAFRTGKGLLNIEANKQEQFERTGIIEMEPGVIRYRGYPIEANKPKGPHRF